MSFDEQLAHIANGVEGSLSCVLMSRDGLKIGSFESSPNSPVDSETLGIEYTGIFNQIYQVSQRSQVGSPLELTIQSQNTTTIFRFLTEDYFVYLTLSPDGNVGKGRFRLRTASRQLSQALA